MFLTRRFFLSLAALVLVTASGYVVPPMFTVGRWLLLVLVLATVAEVWLLWRRPSVTAARSCSERFSNGDDNTVTLTLASTYPFAVGLTIIDELPPQFQRRDLQFRTWLPARGSGASLSYTLRPTVRGEYGFGHIRVFATTRLGLVERGYVCGSPLTVRVYPSFLRLRQYELLAISQRLNEMGVKRVRRIGNNTDFEQIKDYVVGDDYRRINWRATARRSFSDYPRLMVNQYQEERSQQLLCLIDKGRMMQQAHHGMTLLDYAVNASLVLSYVAIRREDKAGLATFSSRFETFVPASRQPGHMLTLMETLYAEQTDFGESDFSALAAGLRHHVSRRSLAVLYTSFNGLLSMRRQLTYLRQLAQHHRLLVVFFADAELQHFVATRPVDTEDYYQHVIAEKFGYEQRLIVQELRRYGIQALLTTPAQLSVDVINRYLAMRAFVGS